MLNQIMADYEILRHETYRRSTWKNGLGHTDEIAIFPPDATLKLGNFTWRLSSARIEQNSPFSTFPDHDRILSILKGQGMRLIHTFEPGEPEENVELGPMQAYEFPGDVPSRCELISGGVTDFSVFLKKGWVEAQLAPHSLQPTESLELNSERDWGRWNFLFASLGDLNIKTEDGTYNLRERDTLKIEGAPMGPMQVSAQNGTPGAFLWITLSA